MEISGMDLKSSRSEIHGFRYPNQPATYLSLGVILGLFLNLLDELLGFGAFLILQTKCLILGEARESISGRSDESLES